MQLLSRSGEDTTVSNSSTVRAILDVRKLRRNRNGWKVSLGDTVVDMDLKRITLGLVGLSFLLTNVACSSSAASFDGGTSGDGSTSADSGSSQADTGTNEPGTKRIMFGADFDSNGSCRDHGTNDQCDLYTATLKLSDGTVTDVKRATNTSVSESYPAWNPNLSVAYFTIFKDVRTKDLGYVDLRTGNTGVLISGASWAAVSPDGSTLLYADSNKMLTTASLSGGGLVVGTGAALTGVKEQEDPDYSTDGRYIVFHEITSTVGAVGQVYDTQTKKTASWGQESGHCGFGINSLITLCDNSTGGGIQSRLYHEGTFGDASLFLADLKASAISVYDSTFAPCQGVSFNYPTFCGDDQHLLVSTSCNQNGEVTFSRLFLIELTGSTPIYRPIGKTLAETYGGTGKSSWTVACLK